MKSPKRILSGLNYLKFLKEYLELFKPKKIRKKITGKFIL